MNQQLRKLRDVFAVDRKKLFLLVAMVLVAMLLWGRLLIKQVPRSAIAVPDDSGSVSTEISEPDPSPLGAGPAAWGEVSMDVARERFAIDESYWSKTKAARTRTATETNSGNTRQNGS